MPDLERPRTRAECRGGVRPCPWVSCRFNLLLDVTDEGAIHLRNKKRLPVIRVDTDDGTFQEAADNAVDEWFDSETTPPSCALDVIEAAEHDLSNADVGRALGVSREAARNLVDGALESVAPASLRPFADDRPASVPRRIRNTRTSPAITAGLATKETV